MREIKFRGKRTDNGEWVYGSLINKFKPNAVESVFWCSLIHDGALSSMLVIPETVGQFTGLKDKNGVDIYEGDIVRMLYSNWPNKSDSNNRTLEEYIVSISLVQIVVWDINGFYVSKEIGGYTQSLEIEKDGGIEIIGNIHDNPKTL